MLAMMAQYFVVGGIPVALEITDAFTRALVWVGVITALLMLRAMAIPIMRQEKWWWHNIFFYLGFIFALGTYTTMPALFREVYFVVTTAGVGAISSLSAFAFIVGTLATFTMRNRMNIFLTIFIVVSTLFFTPYADILGAGFYDLGTWMFTVLMAGSAASQTFVRDLAMLAVVVRAVLTIEKFRPKIME
jgi:hypothetical protein